jgi:hypothetical protein
MSKPEYGLFNMDKGKDLISWATGHAILVMVTSARSAAPGPLGVHGTKPAPSLRLLPWMAGYHRVRISLNYVLFVDSHTVLATSPFKALSVEFENAVLLSGKGTNWRVGSVKLPR